jgi:hypothetical protein
MRGRDTSQYRSALIGLFSATTLIRNPACPYFLSVSQPMESQPNVVERPT